MWGLNAGIAWLLASSQLPFNTEPATYTPQPSAARSEFELVDGKDVLSPKKMLELPRPGAGLANDGGDLALVSVRQYSFENDKTNKTIYILPLQSRVSPVELPLFKGGNAFWLDDRTVAHVRPGSDPKSAQELYAVSVEYTTETTVTPESPVHVGTLPNAPLSNFKYSKSGALVFSAYVYDDFNLSSV
ncbi:hypothetical protein FRC08_016957, partial [Ceratobasidium sp. 394]